MNTKLRGQVVLITGASGGIGLSTARAFADEGASLALHFHTNRAPLDALVPVLESAVPENVLRDFKQVTANLKLAYGKAVEESPEPS